MHALIHRDTGAMRPNINEGPTILAVTLTVTTIALISTAARFYVRISMIRNVGWDDYVMLSSMILCIVGQSLIVPQVFNGAGRHVEYIDPVDFKYGMKLNFITQPIYLFATCFLKLSIGFFLLRIAVKAFYKRLIIGIMVFMAIYTFGCVCTVLFQCTNIRMMYDPLVTGTCWSIKTIRSLSYLNSVLNILTDLAFSIGIPIPMLWGVQMNRRQKASLICILALGVFATAAALVKFTYITTYGRSGDLMWDSRHLTIWTVTECTVGIVAGNLSTLKPLFRTLLVSTYSQGSRKRTQPQYSSKVYGPGSKHRSVVRNYASLGSEKAADGEFKGCGAAGEAYMLTTIDANKTGAVSKIKSGRSSPSLSKDSSDSERRLNNNGRGLSGVGDITVTKTVDVTESVHSREIYEGGRRHERPQAKELV